MLQLILMVLLNLFGYDVAPQPVRLGKKLTLKQKFENWVWEHEYELLVVFIVLMMILFVLVVFMIVPVMDPYNNHFNEVI